MCSRYIGSSKLKLDVIEINGLSKEYLILMKYLRISINL